MHITPFDAWQSEMVAAFFEEHPDGETTCPKCNGEGGTETECGECGHERDVECDLCDGDGVAIINRNDTRQLCAHAFTKQRYLEHLQRDLRRYADYTHNNHYAIAAESGLKVYCRLSRAEVWEAA